jgi:hypothetical protein
VILAGVAIPVVESGRRRSAARAAS